MRNIPFKTIVIAWVTAVFLTACGGAGSQPQHIIGLKMALRT